MQGCVVVILFLTSVPNSISIEKVVAWFLVEALSNIYKLCSEIGDNLTYSDIILPLLEISTGLSYV